MTFVPKHSIRFRQRNGRRGSVIVLVVAVLALLAVIGTVYIVSSRAGRSAATSGNAVVNLDNAQTAVNDQIRRVVGDGMYGADGTIGGLTALGGYGYRQYRSFDMPEFNVNHPGFSISDQTGNPTLPDESWLATNLYRAPLPGNTAGLNFVGLNDLTMPQTYLVDSSNAAVPTVYSPTVFDPTTGTYDIPLLGPPPASVAKPALNFFRVVPDPGTPLPVGFTYADGTNSYNYQDDAVVQMLPFSDGSGTRYRFGLRIIDSSAMANLNVGNAQAPAAYASLSDAQRNGTYFNGYLLSGAAFNGADNAGNLNIAAAGIANPGRLGAYNPSLPGVPTDYLWSQVLYRLENPFRSVGAQATVSYWDNILSAPFDASDELALRSYGNLGTTAIPRPASVWPLTLGNNLGFNARRSFYTTYSYSRDIRPGDGAGAPYQLVLQGLTGPNPSNNFFIWPPYPACVNINPDISTYTQWNSAFSPGQKVILASEELVMAAVNTAQAMSFAGYSSEEQLAFVANYLTFRWNTWKQITTSTGQKVYTLPAGPSFVDATGPCLRNGAQSDYTSDLHTSGASSLFLGYAAQPFLNSFGAHQVPNPPPTPGSTITECAVQLYNPYDVPLSLADYEISWGTGAAKTHAFGADDWIPARGFFVLSLNGWSAGIDPAAQTATDGTFTLTLDATTIIYLKRKYYPRGVPAGQYATVDQYDVSIAIKTTGANETDGLSRPYIDPTPALIGTAPAAIARWIAAIHTPDSSTAILNFSTVKLGVGYSPNNALAATISQPVPLYDRVIELDAVDFKAGAADNSAIYDQQILANIADFNRVMRVCNEIDPTPGLDGPPVGPYGPISGILWQMSGSSISSDHPLDANVHFDFRPDPSVYSPGSTAPTTYKTGDPKAAALLQYLTMTDRVSDYTIDLGDNVNTRGLSKIRIPGRINVNTASAQVLATIPVLSNNPQLIGYILAYRWRTSTSDPRIPASCKPGTVFNFNVATEFPGYGIRTMAELQIPITIAQTAAGLTYPTIYDRDQYWAQMYNSLTVRSDTFIAYAYLEAVRQNPRYSGPIAFNNGSDWYLNVPGAPGAPGTAVSDDPSDTSHPLQRVARRRWVAVVDRSQANFSRGNPVLDPRFIQPQIVAQKDLPR